jgi:hypothetical protein
MMTDRLSLLRDYFPTAVFTGKALVFISKDSRVELTEHLRAGLTETPVNSVIRVRLFSKDPHGYFEPGHYEDFEMPGLSDIAGEIEKFVQSAVGKNIREGN